MAKVIIYSSNTNLALELLTAAALIGQEVQALSINNEAQAEALREAGTTVNLVTAGIDIADTSAVAEILKRAAIELNADTILLSSDRRGKELAGRLAQKLEAGCLTDINAINIMDNVLRCERNSFGGATVATQTIKGRQVLAIAPKVFKPAEKADGGIIKSFEAGEIVPSIAVREIIPKNQDNVDISDADKLVVAGCGVPKENDLAIVQDIADSIGALVGCTKPVATDWKWLTEDKIIGLSGKICNPDLAVILGASGQIQFAVGVRAARVIVSINKDENAPINSMADYYLVADLNDALPAIKNALGK
jgi:electron transfer flavoprotein alpha subunit